MEFIDVPTTFGVVQLSHEEIVLAPIGDVHYGARGFAKRSFTEYLKILDGEYKNVHYVGMGDYLDFTRSTVRQVIKTLAVDDFESMDEYVEEKRNELVHILDQTRGKWVGMLQGNHSWTFRDGSTTETRMCASLNAEFLGDCADVQLNFKTGEDSHTRGKVGIWMHHGVGGRKYPVGHLLDRICPHFPDSDVFLMGHPQVKEYRDVLRMKRCSKSYVERTGVAVITGGWLKGYIAGPSTYVERKAMNPLAVGTMIIKIQPRILHGYFMPRIRVESI